MLIMPMITMPVMITLTVMIATYHHGCLWFDHIYPPERGYGYVAASRFKSKNGVYLFGKVRRTDWLPARDTREAMQHDQIDRSEESASDYDSEEEEAMAIPRDYDDDDDDDSESSDPYEFDAEAMAEDFAAPRPICGIANRDAGYAEHKAYWDELRALRASPGYQITGTHIHKD